ncbi:MAG: putative signal transduction histidine kinase, with phosphoacceptor and binding domain [Nitrososphaeraceae archaeon]|nr:putative signal transduction histidine kinase, with phosphoacceptor and binding domain [Nitrososphaeraceae archaeon]
MSVAQNKDENTDDQKKMSNTEHKACPLCGRAFEKSEKSKFSKATIDGINYAFDTIDCMSMFKRLKSAYGQRLDDFLGNEQYISDPFWDNAIPEEEEIREIQQEEEQKQSMKEGIEILDNPHKIQELGFKLLRSAVNEILLILSTSNAFHRQERLGGLQLLKEVREKNRKMGIRLLSPFDKEIEKIAVQLNHDLEIDLQDIHESLRIKSTILIVDRKFVLYVELKDDTKDDSYKAMGLAAYSNSKSTVLSFVTIFESIRKQSQLLDTLFKMQEEQRTQKETTKRLLDSIKELRIPIRPILALAETIRSERKLNLRGQEDALFDVIVDNAKKLEQLTNSLMID